MPDAEPPPTDADPVIQIQYHFPQIYHACHTRHTRRRSSEHRLSRQDSAYLAHLSRHRGTRPGDLACHLGIGDSTLSAFVKRVEHLGFLERRVSATDRRQVELQLTDEGAAAMSATSVLDGERLRSVLDRLDPPEIEQAVHGLRILAEACRRARLEYTDEELNDEQE